MRLCPVRDGGLLCLIWGGGVGQSDQGRWLGPQQLEAPHHREGGHLDELLLSVYSAKVIKIKYHIM